MGVGVEGCEDSSGQTDKRSPVFKPVAGCEREQSAQHSERGVEQRFVGQRTFFVPGGKGGGLAPLGESVVQKRFESDSQATLPSDAMRGKTRGKGAARTEGTENATAACVAVVDRASWTNLLLLRDRLEPARRRLSPVHLGSFRGRSFRAACLLRPASPKESPHEPARTSLRRE